MEHLKEEDMETDVVDGGGNGNCSSKSPSSNSLCPPSGRCGGVGQEEHDGRTDNNGQHNFFGGDIAGCGDRTDIVVSSMVGASPSRPRPTGAPLPQQSPTESNDSRKIWESLKRRFSGRGGAGDQGPFASCDPHDFEYNMNHQYRGNAIIFNHSDFDPAQHLDQRLGTNKDVADLTFTFERLGFKVEIYNDLKFEKLYAVLEKEALSNNKDKDCIAVIVLTHGREHTLHAFDVEYKPESLWEMFTGDKCPSLAGKPKMFFIQACRGDRYDEGVTLLSPKSRTVVDGPGDGKAYKIPNQADFLIVYSTAPASELTFSDNRTFVSRLFQYLSLSNSGHYSWRNSRSGGCFIQALCKTFDKYAWDMDVLGLTTLINREIAINYESNVPRDISQHQKKQISNTSHTLTRQIRFSPQSVHSTLV